MTVLQRVVFGALLVAASLIGEMARADTAIVVSSCGTPPTTYTAGQNRPTTMDTNGNLCSNGAGGGTTSPTYVVEMPSSAAAVAITTVKSSALESNHVIKSSAGNLYGWSVTTGAVQGWVLLYNGTSAPTAGGAAVAPEKCYYAPANATLAGSFDIPIRFATGIVIVFSSSGCLTNTASATVFISGDAS